MMSRYGPYAKTMGSKDRLSAMILHKLKEYYWITLIQGRKRLQHLNA